MSTMQKKGGKQAMFLLLCLAGTAGYAQTTSLDMKTAIEQALANNYSVKADSMNILAAQYQAAATKAVFLPQVSLKSKSEYNIAIPSQPLPGSIVGQPSKELVPVKFGTNYSLSSGVEVTQTILQKSARLQLVNARLNTEITQTRHNLTREQLVYQVANSFYTLQTDAELIRTTRKDYENLRDIVTIAKAQYENAVLKRIDYESLQINAANKLTQLNQLQTKYDEELTWFKYLLGMPADAAVTIADEIKGIAGTPGNSADLLSKRQDIYLYRQLIESKQTELKSIEAEKKPVLSSYFRFSYQSQFNNLSDAFNSDYRFKNSAIGLTTSISLFDGNRRKNRMHIAESQLQQLRFQQQQQQEYATTEWISANNRLNTDRKNYEIARQNLVLAEQVFTSRKALYAEGVTTLIELLDAERELSNSRNLHTQAMVNVQTSVLNLHKATGTLLTGFLSAL